MAFLTLPSDEGAGLERQGLSIWHNSSHPCGETVELGEAKDHPSAQTLGSKSVLFSRGEGCKVK